MANFRTHLGVGTIAAGLLTTLAFASAIVAEQDILSIALAGVLGSILPDVDLQKSRPSRIIFFFLALFFSFCMLFAQSGKLSVLELWIVWLGVFVFVRYFVQILFHHFAEHRGVFHSILAGLFFYVLTSIIFSQLLNKPPLVSWLAGLFLFLGYIVHLLLDELYSVDFEDTRIKRSFGTALKLFDYTNYKTSGAMAVATIGLFMVAPPIDDVIETVKERPMARTLYERFLPEGSLFGLSERVNAVTEKLSPSAEAEESNLLTGSIKTKDDEQAQAPN